MKTPLREIGRVDQFNLNKKHIYCIKVNLKIYKFPLVKLLCGNIIIA